jgi:hypothetical protein
VFSQNEKDAPKKPADPDALKIAGQVLEAVKAYDAKKQKFQEDVLSMFDKKETISRSKGDAKVLNQLKSEKDNFLKEGKDPTLFFITDQKRSLELAKLDLIKSYEKNIKVCLEKKFDFEADELIKELNILKKEDEKLKPNIKLLPIKTNDPLQPDSKWRDEKNSKTLMTIIERNGQSFNGKFGDREISGKIIGPRIFWLAKDSVALGKSGVGHDNYGVLTKDKIGFKIDFKWGNPPKSGGFFTLRQDKE